MGIKPIETRYKGYRFRSRLEARWAVFFDALGIRWEYEPEGFDLGPHGWYLPDFWLPELDCWAEIKPEQPIESLKLDPRHNHFPGNLIVLAGTPGPADLWRGTTYHGLATGAWIWDYPFYLCECYLCGALGFQYCGRSERNEHLPGCSADPIKDKTYGGDSPRIKAATVAALSARFEHGETPEVR